jgi:DNA-binding PadR family transcriptional regulator
MTMLAVARLGEGAYGGAIREELKRVARRSVTVPTVYVTLVRLEEDGLVRSTTEQGVRGGRPRRIFRLTRTGWRALEDAREAMARMWEGVVVP